MGLLRRECCLQEAVTAGQPVQDIQERQAAAKSLETTRLFALAATRHDLPELLERNPKSPAVVQSGKPRLLSLLSIATARLPLPFLLPLPLAKSFCVCSV